MLINFQVERDAKDLKSLLTVEKDQETEGELGCPALQALRARATPVSIPFPGLGSQ